MVTMEELMRRSRHATCGVAEREVTVSASAAPAAVRLIKAKGFRFIGTGPAGEGRTKIWYVSRGAALL